MIDGLSVGAREWLREALPGNVIQGPVRLGRGQWKAWIPDRQNVRCGHLDGALEDRLRGGHVQIPQVRGECGSVDRAIKLRPGDQRLEFGTKRDVSRFVVHIQWLLAETIPDQGQLPPMPVPHRDREHPDEMADRLANPPLFECGQDDFRIRAAAKDMPVLLELMSEFSEVIDLPVEDQDETLRRR